MMAKILWRWLATRQASFWIMGISLSAIAALGLYIQQLRVEASYCKGQKSAAATINKFSDRLIDRIKKDTDELVNKVEQESQADDCAAQPVPPRINDLVRRQTDPN